MSIKILSVILARNKISQVENEKYSSIAAKE
jgi:hypothetical protein